MTPTSLISNRDIDIMSKSKYNSYLSTRYSSPTLSMKAFKMMERVGSTDIYEVMHGGRRDSEVTRRDEVVQRGQQSWGKT